MPGPIGHPAHAPGQPGARRRSPHARPFRPRRWALLLLVAAGLIVAADLFLPAGPFPPRERRVILVQRGETLRGVARELQRVGVLRGTLGFEVLARLMRLDHHIKAGQYSLRLGITVPALLRAFARGMSGLNLITIPEGLTESEISLLLSNRLGVPIADFDSLAHDRRFLDSLGVEAPSIEGYLSPDTYEFLPGTSPEVAFRTMSRHQQDVLLKAAAGRDSLPLGLSLHQVLILASIVESEAQFKDERARIARVYLNRLQRHMRLQADPTVGYGLGIGPRSRLYFRQLRVESPFNTYLFEGLPPGPICNPGRAAIDAVLNPSPDVKDLYFVARGEGRHLFAETYAQHLRNIETARAMIAAERRAASGREALEEQGVAPESAALVAAIKPVVIESVAHGKPRVLPADTAMKAPAKKGARAPAVAGGHARQPAHERPAQPALHAPKKPGKRAAPADTTAHHAAKKPAKRTALAKGTPHAATKSAKHAAPADTTSQPATAKKLPKNSAASDTLRVRAHPNR